MENENVDGQDDKDIFDAIRDVLDDDDSLSIISSRVQMDNQKIRDLAEPILELLKLNGVQLFSGGDDIRAAGLQNKLDQVNAYAGMINKFLPVLKHIYKMLTENKESQLNNDDWDDMMFDQQQNITPEQMQQQTQQRQQQQQMQQGQIDPDFLSHPGQEYGAQNVSLPQSDRKAINMKAMLEKHMSKFGRKGMNDVVREFEKIGKIDLGMDIDESTPVQEAGQTGPIQQPAEPSIHNMTMKDMVAKHQAKFGGDNMEKVEAEMISAGLSTEGLDFSSNGTGDRAQVSESRDSDYVMDNDDEDMDDAFDTVSQPHTKRARLNDVGNASAFSDDDRDDYLD